ncbi:MAG: ABC transporter permease [Candidatus Omnitrophota bacterium]
MKNVIYQIGKSFFNVVAEVKAVMGLLFDTVSCIVSGPLKRKMAGWDSIVHQMVFAGAQSVTIVFFVSLFTGVVIAMQSAYQLADFGATIYVAPMVSISMARELGPVFTALVVTGRVGSAITAELGTMKVSEQIEALEVMALDPVRFLVVPRFLALLIMLPCLTVMSDMVGVLGGLFVGIFQLDLNIHRYWRFTFDFLTWKDVWTGLIKSIGFAMVISMISCYVGITTSGGAEGVGKSTTRSVVLCFIMIILVDVLFTQLFYFTNV